jgi:signal transduction histidine kinase
MYASPPSPAARAPNRRREWLVLAAAMLVVVGISTATALMLWQQREQTLRTWRMYMDNFSASVAEHAQQVLYTADDALQRIVQRVQEEDGDREDRLREIATTRRMFDFLGAHRGASGVAQDIAIVDLQGQVLANSQAFPPPHVNVHDRDYFKAHLAQPALEVYLSAPVLSRDTGRWTFFLARKIRSGSGHMLGLVITGVEVGYFERFYKSVNLDEAHTAVQLLRRDGTPLARYPQRVGAMAASYGGAPALHALEQALAQGRHSAWVQTSAPRPSNPALADERLVVARAVEAYPLAVVTLATQELMLCTWRESAWFASLGTAALDAVIALLALWTFHSLRRRRLAIEHLSAASAGKTAFLAGIGHEIRTPLHGLLGITRRLMAEGPAPAQQRLLALVDDLLDYSRLETGHLDLERVPFTIAPVVHDCLVLFESQAQSRGVALELYMGSAAHGTPVLGDPLRLAQIINNLLSNALRFTSAGRVALSVAPLDFQRWRLAVSDTGSGMSAEQCRRLFEPIAPPLAGKAQATAHDPGLGLGLGLSIVKRLVQLHDGTVGVESAPGRGTEVWCELLLPPAPAGGTGNAGTAATPGAAFSAAPAPSTSP